MSERVRDTKTLRRIASAAVLSPLLIALLLQSLAPHVHELTSGSASIEAAAASSLPALVTVDTGGCVACRMGSARAGIAGGGASLHLRAGEPARPLPNEATPGLASRLVRAAAPPRAPPVV